MRDRVRDLVAEDRREPGLVLGNRQDAGVDPDFAAGERPRVHLCRVVEERELPGPVRAVGAAGETPPDALHDRGRRRIGRDRALPQHRGVRRRAELALLVGGNDRELAATRVRDRRAGGADERDRGGDSGAMGNRDASHRRAAC